jgi:hypothetical protein
VEEPLDFGTAFAYICASALGGDSQPQESDMAVKKAKKSLKKSKKLESTRPLMVNPALQKTSFKY